MNTNNTENPASAGTSSPTPSNLITQLAQGLELYRGRVWLDKEKEEEAKEMIFDAIRKGAEEQIRESGDPEAMLGLAECYEHGIGIVKSPEKAVYWYQRAADKGNARAMAELARCYRDGFGVEKDPIKAFQWYQQAVKRMWRTSEFRFSRAFDLEISVRKDISQAVPRFRQAAVNGNDAAMYALGWCYHRGVGVEKDPEQAVHWFCAAADKGNTDAKEALSEAMYKLAQHYGRRGGTPKDLEKAIYWFRKADENEAEEKTTPAEAMFMRKMNLKKIRIKRALAATMYRLAECYHYGWGVEKDPKQAMQWLRMAAEGEDKEAMFFLGKCYLSGYGVEKDLEQAVHFFRGAAKAGCVDAMCELVQHYRRKGKARRVAYWLCQAAEMDHVAAMYDLARCYRKGIGVKKDLEKAVHWLREAVDAGNTGAKDDLVDTMYELAWSYREGNGVKKDLKEAIRYFRKAAKRGHIGAQKGLADTMVELAWCYREGTGVEKSEEQAFYRFRAAANREHFVAMVELGKCYFNGIGVEKDEEQAVKWLCEAADKGSTDAKELLQELAPEEAAHLYQLAAKDGNRYAMYELGKCYLAGIGVDRDTAQAAEWFRRAADRGNADAMFELGKCYLDGIGVEKDEARAAKWLCKATDKGSNDAKELLQELAPEKAVHLYQIAVEDKSTYAMYALGKCYLDGMGVERDEEQAAKWLCEAAGEGSTDAKELLQKLDPEKTARLYQIATEAGNTYATLELCKCYLAGLGVEKDESRAIEWFRKAAGEGNTAAILELGRCYLGGTGVEKDIAQARLWLYKVDRRNYEPAEKLLGEIQRELNKTARTCPDPDALISLLKQGLNYYGKNAGRDKTKGKALIREAINRGVEKIVEHAGDVEGQFCLGKCYDAVHGVYADAVEAVKWYRRAADNGYGGAMYCLAECYRAGIGVGKDEMQAAKWLCEAADKGDSGAEGQLQELSPEEAAHLYQMAAEAENTYAMYRLAECHRDGIGVEKDEKQAAMWSERAESQRYDW